MTTITQDVTDIAGVDDNTSWTFYTQAIRESDSGDSIITTKKVRKYPVAGVLTVELDPGPAVVLAADGKHYPFTVPETDSALWPLIQAAVTIPPGTRHQDLLDAVAAWLDVNTGQAFFALLDNAASVDALLSFIGLVKAVDNGDGTITLLGAVTDNGDGTITANTAIDNHDGTIYWT